MPRSPRLPLLLPALLCLAACGESVRDDHFGNDVREARGEDPPVVTEAVAVRIGELGPNFAACNAAGTTRHLRPGETLAVRAAPFESAAEAGRVAAGSAFFVCTRSIDQKWLGIVWDEGGALAEDCNVSAPVPARAAYGGPCRSGWVSSALVKLRAG